MNIKMKRVLPVYWPPWSITWKSQFSLMQGSVGWMTVAHITSGAVFQSLLPHSLYPAWQPGFTNGNLPWGIWLCIPRLGFTGPVYLRCNQIMGSSCRLDRIWNKYTRIKLFCDHFSNVTGALRMRDQSRRVLPDSISTRHFLQVFAVRD